MPLSQIVHFLERCVQVHSLYLGTICRSLSPSGWPTFSGSKAGRHSLQHFQLNGAEWQVFL